MPEADREVGCTAAGGGRVLRFPRERLGCVSEARSDLVGYRRAGHITEGLGLPLAKALSWERVRPAG
jgi:hypothetical protein